MIEAMNFLKAFFQAIIWPSFFIGLYLVSIGQTLVNLREPGRIIVNPFKLSWLANLNIFILQFLFIRLAKILPTPTRTQGYGIVYLIWPMSGWGEWLYTYIFGIKGFITIVKPKPKNS